MEKKCDYFIKPIIFNVILKNRLYVKNYVFVGKVEESIKEIFNKLEKNILLSKSDISKIQKVYSNDEIKLWIRCSKKEIKFIDDIIYLDDTINIIRKKIFFYLSNLNENKFFIENNQELWIINKDPSKTRWGCKTENLEKYIPLGYYYKNYEYIPSVCGDIKIDYNNFVDDIGIFQYKFKLVNNLNNILYDVVDFTCIKQNIIFVNNLEVETDYLKKNNIPVNNIFINGYIKKYWPKGYINYDSNFYLKKYKELSIFFKYEKFILNLIYNKNIINNYLGNCNIVSIRLRSNYCKNLLYDNKLIDDNKYLDLVKVFNLLPVSNDIPFIKYKEKIEWLSPLYKINKDLIKTENKKRIKDWVTSNPRGLIFKFLIYSIKINNKIENTYATISIFSSGTIEVSLSFHEKYNATFDTIINILNKLSLVIDNINNTIIDDPNKKLICPNIHKNKNMIKEGIKTKILFINMLIPILININFDTLKIISNKFTPFIVKGLDTGRDIKYKFKYKRRSNFKNMNEIFDLITLKKNEGYSDREIKIYLQDSFYKNTDDVQKLFDMWKRLTYYETDNIKQGGASIMIPKSGDKIKIYGVNNIIEIFSIYKLLIVVMDIINNNKDYFKNKEFNKFFDDEKYLKTLESNEENNDNINLDQFKNINLSKFIDVKNYINDNININKPNNKLNSKRKSNLISDESLIDPVLRLRCATSGIDYKADTCVDLCEDLYFKNRRLQKYDNKLFRYKGKKGTYSIMCQKPRQPIVMNTDPSKNPKIKKDSYTYAIKYGSDPEHQNYYICPKVWCPYCEIPLSYKSVKNIKKEKTRSGICYRGNCPYGDHQVLIINDDKYDKSDNGLYPSFTKGKHPDGYCLPCCNVKDMRNPKYSEHLMFKRCLGEEVNINDKKDNYYILDYNKIPLQKDRFGALSINLQQLFKNIYEPGHLEKGNEYYLRSGVNLNINQCFLEVILKIFNDKTNSTITLNEFKLFLIKKLTIRLFNSLNNGNLTLIFKLNEDTNAYENYKSYLLSNTFIDYKYTWDFLSRPGILFPDGLNIFIFTSNTILCPKGNNIDDMYDLNRQSIFIFNYNKYYEPIYLLKYKKRNKIEVVNIFDISYNIPSIFHSLIVKNCRKYYDIDWKRVLSDNMKLLNIKYNIFSTKEPSLSFVENELKNMNENYNIECQVVDNYNKVIGLLLKNKLFYPVEATNIRLDYKVCDKDYPLLDFKETSKLYFQFKLKTKLPYNFVGKVMDQSNKLINVLVLNTGRYVFIKPLKNINNSLPLLNIQYFSDAEKYIENGEIVDKEAYSITKKYDYFDESYIRYKFEISKYLQSDLKVKNEIIYLIKSDLEFNEKLNKLKKIIQNLNIKLITNKRIEPIKINNYKMSNIRIPCYLYSKKYKGKLLKDICLSDYHCSYLNKKCSLYFPLKNQINNKNNNILFLEQLTNNLLQNNIVQNEILNNEFKEIIDPLIYYPKKNEIFIYGIDYIEQFEDLYNKNKDKFISNKIPLDDTNPTLEFSIIDKMYYSQAIIDREDDIYLEELNVYWNKILGDKYKVFKTNIIFGSMFYSVSRAYNTLVNDEITPAKVKCMLIDYLSSIKTNTLCKILNIYQNTYKDDTISVYNKDPQVFLLDFYSHIAPLDYKGITNFNQLKDYISNNSYTGCILDIYFMSIMFNKIIGVINYRKTPKNIKGFRCFGSGLIKSNDIILLYSELLKESDRTTYNVIQLNGNYIFKKNNFNKDFLKLLIEDCKC